MTRPSWSLVVRAIGVAALMAALMIVGRLSSGRLRSLELPATPPVGSPTTLSPVVARIPFPDGVTAVAVGPHVVWAAHCAVSRVDPDSNQVVARVDGTGQPGSTCVQDVAIGAGAVWGSVPGVGLVRIAPAANRVVARVPVGLMLAPLAVTASGVWTVCCGAESSSANGMLIRVDPGTNRVAARIPLPARVTSVGAGPSGVWVVGSGRIWRVDPATGRVVATIAIEIGERVMVDRDAVWVGADGEVLRIDPRTSRVVARLVWATGVGVAVVHGVPWTTSPGGLLRLDRETGPAVSLDAVDPLSISDLAASQDAIWIATWSGVDGPSLVRVDPRRLR